MSEDLVERQDGIEKKLALIIKIGYGVLTMGLTMGGYLARTDSRITANTKSSKANYEAIKAIEEAADEDHDILIEIRTKVDQLIKQKE